MRHYLALAGRFFVLYFKSQLEYRQSFVMRYVIQSISRTVELLAIWILLGRFEHVHGWTFDEVVFLFALNLLSYGLAGLALHGPVVHLEGLVRKGDFDAYLVQPVSPLFHLAMRYFNAAFLGHVLLGVVILGLCVRHLEVGWGLAEVLWLAVVVLGAALVQAAILLAAGATSFWLVKSRALVNTAIYGVRAFVVYPISIYDRWIQVLLTLIVPFAFVSFFPAESLLGKGEGSIFPAFFRWGTPLVGAVAFLISYRLWNRGLDHYQSTGT